MQLVEGVLSAQGEGVTDPLTFMPVGEAARALGVSPMTVRRLYDARKLPGFRHGRSRQILRVFVDAFVSEIRAGRQPVLQEYASAWFERAAHASTEVAV
jgi:excisionase family DNA binding protein